MILTHRAKIKVFDELTGVPGSWDSPEYEIPRNIFIAGWDAALDYAAETHYNNAGQKELPTQTWMRALKGH